MHLVMQRLIVLGTGTQVGKTWVTTAIVAAAHRRQIAALALKPIETGIDETTEAGSDAALLAQASGTPLTKCYRFPDPLTPWLAAERVGQTVDLRRVQAWVAREETRYSDITSHVLSLSVIESAGGVFSPLGPQTSNYDLALSLAPARWLLVAPNRIGVLHDVVATLEAMKARGRAPDHLVLNQVGASDSSSPTNAATLRRLALACPITENGAPDPEAGADLIEQLLDPG
jgi:dethiobiotin synthetase